MIKGVKQMSRRIPTFSEREIAAKLNMSAFDAGINEVCKDCRDVMRSHDSGTAMSINTISRVVEMWDDLELDCE